MNKKMTNTEIDRKIKEAEQRIKELFETGDLKRLTEEEKYPLAQFYRQKSLQRLETAKFIFQRSLQDQTYNDFSEAVSAAYYAMYYIVHSYIAACYKLKLRDGIRGAHAITLHLILSYLIRTNALARHLYEDYYRALQTTAEIQAFEPDEFKEAAYKYVRNYQQERQKREIFTYFASKNAEQLQAQRSLETAEEFISTIRQLMI